MHYCHIDRNTLFIIHDPSHEEHPLEARGPPFVIVCGQNLLTGTICPVTPAGDTLRLEAWDVNTRDDVVVAIMRHDTLLCHFSVSVFSSQGSDAFCVTKCL